MQYNVDIKSNRSAADIRAISNYDVFFSFLPQSYLSQHTK